MVCLGCTCVHPGSKETNPTRHLPSLQTPSADSVHVTPQAGTRHSGSITASQRRLHQVLPLQTISACHDSCVCMCSILPVIVSPGADIPKKGLSAPVHLHKQSQEQLNCELRPMLVQAGGTDGSTQQVAARAKNTIDGQLNFPDPQHGPKPQVLVQQFEQKVNVSALLPCNSASLPAQRPALYLP